MSVVSTSIPVPARLRTPAFSVAHLVELAPLLAILTLQAVASLSLRNTAFQDEANYLYIGREIFNHLVYSLPMYEPFAPRYLSGSAYIYPLLAGALDRYWGLEAARDVSLCCMLFTTLAVYLLAKRIYDRDSAVMAAGLFAIQGPVLFLGHLATYDAMCLALLALAAVLALYADAAREPVVSMLVGAVLLLAVATKYVGVLFVPSVLAILAWQAIEVRGWRVAVVRVAAAVLVATVGAIIALKFGAWEAVRGSTVERHVAGGTARIVLAQQVATLGGFVLALALLGLLLSGWRRLPIAIVVLGSGLLAPAYHIYEDEAVSLQKHVAYGLFFAAPLAGYVFARLSGYGRGAVIGRQWLAGLAVCLVLFGWGFRQAQSLFAEWPNSDAMIQALLTQVRPGAGHILAEEAEVPRYYPQNIVAWWQRNHLFWFDYTDAAGRHLSGEEAYKAAIADGYLSLVSLRYGPNATTAHAIDGGLRHGKRYKLIAMLPSSTVYGPGYYWIWRKT
jgi:hypothetical protein